MDGEKKFGIVLILIGFCIPLLAVPFLSGYSKDKSLIGNLYGTAIELNREGPHDNQPAGIESPDHGSFHFSRLVPKRIPFRFFLGVTLIFLYMGIARIARANERERAGREGFH